MFTKYSDVESLGSNSLFERLKEGVELEQLSDERQGAVLAEITDGMIPIVRTTTSYERPTQIFTDAHKNLIEKIKTKLDGDTTFNNAIIEVYDPAYIKMRFHSDQALDLVPESSICIFSCYEDPHEPCPRILIFKNKITGDTSEMTMDHNSCIIFSTTTNEEFRHKIVTGNKRTKSKWLGLTLRLSRTYIYSRNDEFYIASGTSLEGGDRLLTSATEEEEREFYKHKSLENAQIGYEYPRIQYTLSRH